MYKLPNIYGKYEGITFNKKLKCSLPPATGKNESWRVAAAPCGGLPDLHSQVRTKQTIDNINKA